MWPLQRFNYSHGWKRDCISENSCSPWWWWPRALSLDLPSERWREPHPKIELFSVLSSLGPWARSNHSYCRRKLYQSSHLQRFVLFRLICHLVFRLSSLSFPESHRQATSNVLLWQRVTEVAVRPPFLFPNFFIFLRGGKCCKIVICVCGTLLTR